MANVGSLDRIIRLVAGGGLIAYTFLGDKLDPSSPVGIGAIVVGAILALTAVVSFCPLYALLGLRTRS